MAVRRMGPGVREVGFAWEQQAKRVVRACSREEGGLRTRCTSYLVVLVVVEDVEYVNDSSWTGGTGGERRLGQWVVQDDYGPSSAKCERTCERMGKACPHTVCSGWAGIKARDQPPMYRHTTAVLLVTNR